MEHVQLTSKQLVLTSNHFHWGSMHEFGTDYGFFNNSSCKHKIANKTMLKCLRIVSPDRMKLPFNHSILHAMH